MVGEHGERLPGLVSTAFAALVALTTGCGRVPEEATNARSSLEEQVPPVNVSATLAGDVGESPPSDGQAAPSAPTAMTEEEVHEWVLKTHHGVAPPHLSDAELDALFNQLATAGRQELKGLQTTFREALYAMESSDERKNAMLRFNQVMASRPSGGRGTP